MPLLLQDLAFLQWLVSVLSILLLLSLAYIFQHTARKSTSSTEDIHSFTNDFTELARQNSFDPVIGRNKEIRRLIQILSRRKKNNAIIIGESGVGKTAIVEQFATELTHGNVPPSLQKKRLLNIDIAAMVAGTKYRGEFEERLRKLESYIESMKGNVIIFVDEIHTLVNAGEAEGGIGAADILKPALSHGDIQIIGATTTDEYENVFKKDSALERRFQPLLVGEFTLQATIDVLKQLREKYEKHHQVVITDRAISEAVEIAAAFLPDRHFPDKAIDLIDEAGAKVHLWAVQNPRHSLNRQLEVTPEDIREVLGDWINKDLTHAKPNSSWKSPSPKTE